MPAKASSTADRHTLLVALRTDVSRPAIEQAVMAYPLAKGPDWDTAIGYVWRRDPTEFSYRADFFLEIRHQNYSALVPCHRGTRADDPEGLFVLADGSLWMAKGMTRGEVVAQVCRRV